MRIKKGDKIEEIVLPRHDGTPFKLSETKGKKVLLTFYRIAGCSFCNLRINELQKRFSEFGDNFTHVGIFHSPVDNLGKYMNKHGYHGPYSWYAILAKAAGITTEDFVKNPTLVSINNLDNYADTVTNIANNIKDVS